MILIKEAIQRKTIPGFLVGIVALLLCTVVAPVNRFVASGLLFCAALFVYLYCVFAQSKRNWWDIRALFSAVWLSTNALAVLRLTGYQVLWESETWVCQAIAYAAFHIGVTLADIAGTHIYDRLKDRVPEKIGMLRFGLRKERLFWICFFVTIFGLLCFTMNVLIRGFVPYFVAGGGNDYLNFYTKWYLFAVAATMICGLDYYVLKTQKLSLIKKAFLWFSILYSTIVFPILVVNRSALLTAALSFITVFYYMNRKRLTALLLCAVVYLCAFAACTNARGYSDSQLNAFFEPVKVEIDSETTTSAPDVESTSEPASENSEVETSTDNSVAESSTDKQVAESSTDKQVSETTSESELVSEDRTTEYVPSDVTQAPDSVTEEPQASSFQLSGMASFIYSYLTVSHDNINEAVRNDVSYTYGLRQLAPFNVILRISKISEIVEQYPVFKVREHLNTLNLIGDAYYDLGIVGVAVLMLIWSFAFGLIQTFYLKTSGIFSMLALGNIMTPVVLCFFASWMSIFSFWMHCGVVLLMFIAASISIEKNK